MAAIGESDEAFALRLQEQELGLNRSRQQNALAPLPADANTPLMADFNQMNLDARRNPTVINTRLGELYAGRATVLAVILTNLPQVLATIIVLWIHWNDADVCTSAYTNRWIAWSGTSSLRMFLYTSVIIYLHVFKSWLDERPDALAKMLSIRNFLDVIGILWFVVGNLWLFGDDAEACSHPEKSAIYMLCYSLLVISYLQICLPCILVILFLPILCFCMPCLIRILARIQDIHAVKGANEAALDSLNLTVIGPEQLRSVDNSTCPICINEMTIGEQARYLPCRHLFHRSCVDEWLRVNATCPTCRASIFVLGSNSNAGADVVAAARGSTNEVNSRYLRVHRSQHDTADEDERTDNISV